MLPLIINALNQLVSLEETSIFRKFHQAAEKICSIWALLIFSLMEFSLYVGFSCWHQLISNNAPESGRNYTCQNFFPQLWDNIETALMSLFSISYNINPLVFKIKPDLIVKSWPNMNCNSCMECNLEENVPLEIVFSDQITQGQASGSQGPDLHTKTNLYFTRLDQVCVWCLSLHAALASTS